MSWHDCKYLYKKEELMICRSKERLENERCKPYCKRDYCAYCRI